MVFLIISCSSHFQKLPPSASLSNGTGLVRPCKEVVCTQGLTMQQLLGTLPLTASFAGLDPTSRGEHQGALWQWRPPPLSLHQRCSQPSYYPRGAQHPSHLEPITKQLHYSQEQMDGGKRGKMTITTQPTELNYAPQHEAAAFNLATGRYMKILPPSSAKIWTKMRTFLI